MKLFGLTGYPLEHSRSPELFSEIAGRTSSDVPGYRLFPMKNPAGIRVLAQENPRLSGINVTIPLKSSIIPFLDETDEVAAEVGAVNTILIERRQGRTYLKGYNTDVFGFKTAYLDLIEEHCEKALILGTGGASKAACYVLRNAGIDFSLVTRKRKEPQTKLYQYEELTRELLLEHHVIINTTPAGMFPATDTCPPIPYQHIVEKHLCIDLIYNPEETLFLKKAKKKRATGVNGWQMLVWQAAKSWEIWNL
ncbi:MAG: shikimate dehydrogenase [Bacteroidales bacterium]|nr:shikimate dehydrogenase [Bacteroidales bacterium]